MRKSESYLESTTLAERVATISDVLSAPLTSLELACRGVLPSVDVNDAVVLIRSASKRSVHRAERLIQITSEVVRRRTEFDNLDSLTRTTLHLFLREQLTSLAETLAVHSPDVWTPSADEAEG